ncbi:MAG: hypothetical protein ABI266_10575 [Ginsengibacter sp.]
MISFQIGCAQQPKKIDMIITNDYMSERNLSFMGGPIPANYQRPLIDSLENSFVENFVNNNLREKKYYNKIGALYFSEINFYDGKNRPLKTIKIDEFQNDTCIFLYDYTDSLKFTIHRRVTNLCKNEWLDFYNKYNQTGEKTEIILKVNDKLLYKQEIENVSKNERRIKSFDGANRLSTYTYKYNDKDLLVFEKKSEWDYIIKGEYFQKNEVFEYLYKYDSMGNWVERIKQNYQPEKNMEVKPTHPLPKDSNELIKIDAEYAEAIPGIKEKLVRKIYYK